MTTNSIIENRLTKSCPGTSPGAFWGTPLRAKRLKKEKNNRRREQKPMCAQHQTVVRVSEMPDITSEDALVRCLTPPAYTPYTTSEMP